LQTDPSPVRVDQAGVEVRTQYFGSVDRGVRRRQDGVHRVALRKVVADMCKVPRMYLAAVYGVPEQGNATGLEGEVVRGPDGGHTGPCVLQQQPGRISPVLADQTLTQPTDIVDDTANPGDVVVDDVEDSLGEFRGLAELQQGVRPR
jgi:hypothetical protein